MGGGQVEMSMDEAVIHFPIKFVVDEQNVDDVESTINDIIEGNEQKTINDIIKGDKKEDVDKQLEALEKLEEFIKTTDKKGLKTLSSFAKNPGGLVENKLLGLLGRAGIHGAIAVAIITMIIASPEIIMSITRALAVKGGPLNQDYHRFFADETQRGISRELQYRRAVGLDVIISNSERGFLLQDPFSVYNSLIDIDTTRVSRLSSNNTKHGYLAGMGS